MLSPPTIHPTQTLSWEREEVKWTGEKERKKQAEISREERQRLEGGCVTDSFRTILFYIFGNWSYFIFIFFFLFVCLWIVYY